MGVLLIVPAAPTVMLLEKPEVGDVETSKPSGARMVIPTFMLAPETVKLVVVDAVPAALLKLSKLPVMVMTAGGTAENPTTPLELIVMVPSYMLLPASIPLALIVPVGLVVARIR